MAPDPDVDALVLRYRPLALKLAQRYVRTPDQREDLEQVACLGLVKAARRFDRSRGTAFSTFAMPTILGELRRHCRDTRWALHVPRPIQERVQAARQLEDAYAARFGRSPTTSEAASALGCSEEDVLEARMAAACLAPASLNMPAPTTDGSLGELIDAMGETDPGYENAERRELVERALEELPARARLALKLRTVYELSMPEIAEHLGLSAPQAGRLVRGALRAMREAIDGADDVARPVPVRSRVVSLPDADPGLFAELPPRERGEATRLAIAPRLDVRPGEWNAGPASSNTKGHLGYLLCSGALLRTVDHRAELVGPGDLIRPWESPEASWDALAPTVLAVLDASAARMLCRWPSVVTALVGRTTRRSHALAEQLAMSDVRRIDERLVGLFGTLAARWGRPDAAGVTVPLALTHDMVARLVGAHRPTVTSSLRRLTAGGAVVRRADRTWLVADATRETPELAA
jgi:RNA polymerase sigma-B factor